VILESSRLSDNTTGGVLSMKFSDELWKPVAFISKSLSDTEQNYEIHDKEILAVVRCLEAWRHFLEGTTTKFEIWTDHKNLEYFMISQTSFSHISIKSSTILTVLMAPKSP